MEGGKMERAVLGIVIVEGTHAEGSDGGRES